MDEALFKFYITDQMMAAARIRVKDLRKTFSSAPTTRDERIRDYLAGLVRKESRVQLTGGEFKEIVDEFWKKLKADGTMSSRIVKQAKMEAKKPETSEPSTESRQMRKVSSSGQTLVLSNDIADKLVAARSDGLIRDP